jgi:hypothetical protein
VNAFPANATAGTAYSLTVTAYDAYSNVATGYQGTVNLSSTDPDALFSPASFTFAADDAGTHSFSATLETAGTQSITAKDPNKSSIMGVQSSIAVSAAPASILLVAGYPSTTAGAIHSFTVTARDRFGNIANGYTGTIHFESSDDQAAAGAGLPPDYTFHTGVGQDNGVHVFSAILKTAGTQSISAHDTVIDTITDTQSGIVVSPGVASRLVFGQQPTDATAGSVITPAPSVRIEDLYGNVVTKDSSTVTLTLSDGTFEGGSRSLTASASAGVATFRGLKIDVAGSKSVSAADGSLAPSGASNSFRIDAAATAALVIHTQPSSTAIAGQEFTTQPQVYEFDRFGNLETLDSSTVVTATASGGNGSLQGSTGVTVSGGVATFTNLGDNTAGTISLTVRSGTLDPAISNEIEIMAARATQLVVTTPPPAPLLTGQTFTLVVAARDPYGNVDPGFNGNVTVSIPNDPSLTTTVGAQDGVATFVGLALNQSDSGESLQFVANGLSAAATGPVQLPPAPMIVSEHVVTFQKRNKRGKKVGKPVFQGFALVYNEPMNPSSAGLAANYHVATTTRKRVKKKTATVLKPVSITAVYNSATDTVTLTVKGKPNFGKGGQILVTATSPGGVTSAVGEPLTSSDTKFIVSSKAKRVQGPA